MSNQTTMTPAEMQAEIAKLQAENAKLKGDKAVGSIRVTEKGGLAVYGLGRFPVTLYKSQWVKLLSMIPQIEAFIQANGDKLTEKPAKAAVEAEVSVA